MVRWFKGMLWETFACHWVEQCFPDLSGIFSTRPIQRIVAFCWVVRCFPFAHVDGTCCFVPPLSSASTAKNYKTRIDSRRRGIFWGGQLRKKNVLSIAWEDDPLRFHTNRRLRLDTRAPDLFDNSGGCVWSSTSMSMAKISFKGKVQHVQHRLRHNCGARLSFSKRFGFN